MKQNALMKVMGIKNIVIIVGKIEQILQMKRVISYAYLYISISLNTSPR